MRNALLFTYLLLLLCMKAGISFSQHRLPCRVESNYPSDWHCLGPKNTDSTLGDQHFGMVTAISVNPKNKNEIYVAGSSSGLFVTLNGGKSWECLTDNAEFPVLGIKHIHVNYLTSPRKILCVTGESFLWYDASNCGIIRSTDGGKSWTTLFQEQKGLFNVFPFHGFLQDSLHDMMYAYGSKNILRSIDGGSSWLPIFSVEKTPGLDKPSEYNIKELALNQSKNELFVALVAYPVKEGETMRQESRLLGISACDGMVADMQVNNYTDSLKTKYSHPDPIGLWTIRLHKPRNTSDILYVNTQYAKSMSQVIYYFNMESHQVERVVLPNKGAMHEDLGWKAGLYVNPINPSCMYMAGNTLHQSLDSGKTFQPLYSYSYGDHEVPHADIRSCLIRSWSNDGTQDEIYLGTDGGLSYSKNSGQTFTNMNGHFLPLTQFYGLGISPFSSAISAGSQDNSIFTYLPKQQQWIYNNHGDGYDVEYNMRYPMEAYGQYNYLTLFKTTNDVAAFNEPLRNDMFRDGSNKKTLQAYPNGDLYFAERDLYHYHRSTQQWDKYPLPTPHQALAFEVAPSDSSVIYVSSLWSGLYKSTDGGKSFQNITASLVVNGYNLGGTRFHAICVHPKNPKELWLGLGYLGDYFDNCRQSIRVIHSMDGGATWTDYSMGLPVYSVSDLVFLEGTQQGLFAATLEGIYFREDSTRSWGLYSTNFPKCVVPEMKIDYCRGKLVAATYGRGLWETKLPSCDYNAPLKIAGTTLWRLDDTLAALPILTDVDLGRKGKLRIACPVYMADGKRILYKGSLKNRVQFEGRGSILNGCGGQWGGIQKKK